MNIKDQLQSNIEYDPNLQQQAPEISEDIMDFAELRGYIWGWLSNTVNNKEDYEKNKELIKALTSIDYYFDWFLDRVDELEAENDRTNDGR